MTIEKKMEPENQNAPGAKENISHLEWPKVFQDSAFLEEMVAIFKECSNPRLRVWDADQFNRKPLKQRLAYAFVDWLGDLNEIVDHVNIATADLLALSERKNLSAQELWARYRMLVRITLTEFYRVKEASEPFYKDLQKLGLICEADRRGFSQMTRDILEPLIQIRNQITHKGMHVLEEELRAFFTVIFETGLGAKKELRDVLDPAVEIGEIASKIGSELLGIGQRLFGALQRISDELARLLVEHQADLLKD